MGLLETYNDISDFLTGKIEKAVITIIDKRTDNPPKKEEGVKTKSGESPTGLGGISGKVAEGAIDKAKDAAKNAAMDEVKKRAGDYAALADLKSKSVLGKERNFEVQFNPSTLRISARKYASQDLRKADGSQNARNINEANPYPDMELSVTLIFAKVVPSEAFLYDSDLRNASSLVNYGLRKLAEDSGETDLSVQQMVEGFIGAIRDTGTREIVFTWNKMRYEGLLIGVRTKYSMFNLYGQPIRGEVSLTIRLSDSDLTATDMGYWEDAYDTAFGFDPNADSVYGKLKSGMESTVSTLKQVQNGALQAMNLGALGVGVFGSSVNSLSNLITDELLGDGSDPHAVKRKDTGGAARNHRAERKFESGTATDRKFSMKEDNRKTEQEKRDAIKKSKEDAADREEMAKEKPDGSAAGAFASINERIKQPSAAIPMTEKKEKTGSDKGILR